MRHSLFSDINYGVKLSRIQIKMHKSSNARIFSRPGEQDTSAVDRSGDIGDDALEETGAVGRGTARSAAYQDSRFADPQP